MTQNKKVFQGSNRKTLHKNTNMFRRLKSDPVLNGFYFIMPRAKLKFSSMFQSDLPLFFANSQDQDSLTRII